MCLFKFCYSRARLFTETPRASQVIKTFATKYEIRSILQIRTVSLNSTNLFTDTNFKELDLETNYTLSNTRQVIL